MRKASLFVSALAISVLILSSFALAATSKVIPLQGKLTQPNGLTYNGQYSMTFKIYSVATSGTSLYTETISNVPVSAGLFSIILGESIPIPLAFDQDYYIEISIGSETLSPRQRLLSSPYAITAQNVAGGSVSSDTKTDVNHAFTLRNSITNKNWNIYQLASDDTTPNGFLLEYGNGSQFFRRLTIDQSGNVGIGTTSPGEKLDVAGSIQTTGTGGNGGRIVLKSTAQGGHQYEIYSDTPSAGDLGFFDRTTNINRLVIKSDGNVGIGTQTPQEKLDVAGTVVASRVKVYSGTNPNLAAGYQIAGGSIGSETTYAYNAICVGNQNGDCTGVGGTVIKPNTATFGGNVGIGTSNPSQALDVVGNGVFRSSTDSNHAITLYNNPRDKTWNIYQLNSTDTTPNGFLLEYGNGSQFFRRLTIDQSGNVGIGTTSPGEKLDVAGNVKATGVCIGSDCRTSWPAAISGDVQFNSITASSDITSAGNVKAAGNIAVGLLAPSISSVSASATSQGLLNTAASYCYQVTAIGLGGETKPSTQVCTTTGAGQNTINLSWTPVTFATSYKIYGRVNNAIGFLATASTTAFTDVGSITPGSAPNPSSTTGTLTTTGSATFGGNLIVNGNVGIGTTAPQSTLDVAGSLRASNATIGDGVIITTSGKVGVGTTAPKATLDVNGDFAQYSTTNLKLLDFEYVNENQTKIKRYYMNRNGQPAMALEILGKTYEKSDSDVILDLTNPNNYDTPSSCCPACISTFTCPLTQQPSVPNKVIYIYAMPSGNSLDFKLSYTSPNQYLYNPNNASMKAIAGFLVQNKKSFAYFSYDPITKYVELPFGTNPISAIVYPTANAWTEVSYSDYVPSQLARNVRIGGYPIWRNDGNSAYTGVALSLRSKGSTSEGEYAGYSYHGFSYYTVDYPNYHDLNIINDQRSVEYHAQPLGNGIGSVYIYLAGYYMR